MKNIFLLTALLNAGICVAEEIIAVEPAPEHKQEAINVSKLIGMNYLQFRKGLIKKDDYLYKDWTLADKVFGKDIIGSQVKLHQVTLDLKREDGCIVIESSLIGLTEDFENREVLENEKKLLKFILIYAYFDKLKEMEGKGLKPLSAVVIDRHTKVVVPPEHLMYIKKERLSFYNDTTVIDEKHMGMQLITVFSAAEFDELIQEYFVDPIPLKPEPIAKEEPAAQQKSDEQIPSEQNDAEESVPKKFFFW